MPRVTTPNLLYRFGIRWLVCVVGLWVAAILIGNQISYESGISAVIVGGLILAIVNSIIKPMVVILSLPAILFTLGLFMIVINGLMIMLVAWVYDPLQVSSIWGAMLAGMIIGLINYLVTAILEDK